VFGCWLITYSIQLISTYVFLNYLWQAAVATAQGVIMGGGTERRTMWELGGVKMCYGGRVHMRRSCWPFRWKYRTQIQRRPNSISLIAQLDHLCFTLI